MQTKQTYKFILASLKILRNTRQLIAKQFTKWCLRKYLRSKGSHLHEYGFDRLEINMISKTITL